MTDPFAILGVEPRFDLDLASVERRHRELSKALHPDRYAGATAGERRLALGKAIEVNEAFRAVRDPVRRAEALARRLGIRVGEQVEPQPAPDLLMDMLEAREELSAAHAQKDAARVAALGRAMAGREGGVLERLGAAFGGAHDAKTILSLLGELRYVRRFLEEAAAIEEELGG